MKEQLKRDLTDLVMQASLILPKNKLDKITISTDKETFDMLVESMSCDNGVKQLNLPEGIHKTVLAFEITDNKDNK